jgi:Domain of unknown function (DUF3291)
VSVQYYHLAQVNIARAREPLGAPLMAPFVARLDGINALAEASPGFVWRLGAGSETTTSYVTTGDLQLIVNMSVWESLEALRQFTFQGGHADVMRRRAEWFESMTKAHLALWWIPAGHEPTLSEARERLGHLRARGEGPAAFTFRSPHPMPDQPQDPPPDGSAATVSYDRLAFRSLENPDGEVDGETRFYYRQRGSRVWATYRGGAVAFGTLVAAAAGDGRLDMRYQHVNRDGAWREGQCYSTPERLPDGRLRLHESWQWTTGAVGQGQSTVEQVASRVATGITE